MERDKLLEKIKSDFPQKAIDINESLGLLKEVVNDTIEKIVDKTGVIVKSRNLEQMKVYYEMVEELYSYETKIEDIMNFFDEVEVEVEEETDEDTEKKTIPNYSEYLVDNNVEHTLYEDFTHKRPFGFKINDKHIIEVKTWKEMLVKTCEYLIAVNEKKFMSFENNDAMNGKKNKYFSTNPSDMRKPRKIADKIYVETNQSGNAIRNLMIKVLKEYEIKVSDYKIYFRADYSTLKTN